MKILEEMFTLNTVITEIKRAIEKEYNFEAKADELETNIHLIGVEIPLEVQLRYAKFNDDVKRLANEMIAELTEQRDKLTLRLIQQKIKDNESEQ